MIEASGLRKSFRTSRRRKVTNVDAVRGVDFAVQRGEIFGFLGPNGAGKSTTLRMLATLISPDGGDATIAGADLRRAPAQVRQRIGFVAQASGTYLPVPRQMLARMVDSWPGFAEYVGDDG